MIYLLISLQQFRMKNLENIFNWLSNYGKPGKHESLTFQVLSFLMVTSFMDGPKSLKIFIEKLQSLTQDAVSGNSTLTSLIDEHACLVHS